MRPSTTSTPSARSSAAHRRAFDSCNRPLAGTMRHQGRSSLWASRFPTALAAPGKPASSATSP